ncbi:MAG TPA: zinc ABC transporter permease subunit ZnuB [Devosia sp.]|nr:zinc ABC transporter permease subunit ZnuB [Devosia sp.]
MFDDFLVRALFAGVGLALVAGPLGCFVVWRRMSYFGETMAHSALLGIALSMLWGGNLMLGVFVIGVLVAIALLVLEQNKTLSVDALLGILSHSTLAVGLVLLALMPAIRVDLMGFLFGDILSVSRVDIVIIYIGGALILGVLVRFWRPLLAATVSDELAQAEGLKPRRAKIILMLLLASVIAIAMKLVGVLLITSLLIIPAATARRFAASPEQMALIAALLGSIAVSGGLFGSLTWDTPTGPSIVVAALLIFLLSLALPVFGKRKR